MSSTTATAQSLETNTAREWNLVIRLSIMMFLEFAVWGAWSVMLGTHMEKHLHFTGQQVAQVYLTLALGAMLSPLIAGWIADRFVPNQIFTGIVHLLGAVLLFLAWKQTSFGPMFVTLLIYSVLYMPTIALTNAIAFHHMKDSKKFGSIRVWGTIGWIAISWTIVLYLYLWRQAAPDQWRLGDILAVGGILSIVMGLYCFTLPNTPPAKGTKNPYAFFEAFRMVGNGNFAVLLIISFIVAIELPFYYSFTNIFLTDSEHGVGLTTDWATAAMSLGQIAEMFVMLLVAPALKNLGMRTTVVLGILAWPVRYGIFALGQPAWLIVAAQALHGICYAFFFVAGMIAVERLCKKDIRASAQGLMVFATNGVGMLIGSLISGYLFDLFIKQRPAVSGLDTQLLSLTQSIANPWAKFFLVPIAVTILGAVCFALFFSERKYQQDSARVEAAEAHAR